METPRHTLPDRLKQVIGGAVALGGFGLGLFGVLGVMVGVVEIFAPKEGETRSNGVAITLIALVFAATGRFLWTKGLAPYRNARRRAQLLGYLRAQERARLSDVAAYLKVSEDEAQAMTDTLIGESEVDLVYLADERRYVHRRHMDRQYSVTQRCPSCDALVGVRDGTPGEMVICTSCQTTFAAA